MPQSDLNLYFASDSTGDNRNEVTTDHNRGFIIKNCPLMKTISLQFNKM